MTIFLDHPQHKIQNMKQKTIPEFTFVFTDKKKCAKFLKMENFPRIKEYFCFSFFSSLIHNQKSNTTEHKPPPPITLDIQSLRNYRISTKKDFKKNKPPKTNHSSLSFHSHKHTHTPASQTNKSFSPFFSLTN